MTDWKRTLIARGWRYNQRTHRYHHPKYPSGNTCRESSEDWGYTLREALVRAGVKCAG